MSTDKVSLPVSRLVLDGDFSAVRCARCRGSLDLHQPDTETPQRILATCDECKTWYLIEVERGWIFSLPVVPSPGDGSRVVVEGDPGP
jgi:hypothetical protein